MRTNLTGDDPAKLWEYYIQLVAVEEAFRNLKGDLAIRPVFHQDETRIEAHIFIVFLAYCLFVRNGGGDPFYADGEIAFADLAPDCATCEARPEAHAPPARIAAKNFDYGWARPR